MEHSYEACRAKAEELIQDTVCTIGLGARRLTDAARRQMELADLRAEVNACLRELGELLDPPLTRSGVNHRLRRLMELAEENGR